MSEEDGLDDKFHLDSNNGRFFLSVNKVQFHDVVGHWGRRLSLPGPCVTSLALLLAALIGVLDFRTGRDIAISSFYLIPICWASWAAGRRVGLLLAIISTVLWFVADLKSGYLYSHTFIPYWNALMLLIFFLVVVYLIGAFQSAQRHLEKTVEDRTAALRAEMSERKRLEIAKLQSERLAVVGIMAAELAHEVRNPLGSITLNLDLIHEEIRTLSEASGLSPGEGHRLVSEMREEVQRILRVIGEYLQFARMPKPQRAPLALNEMFEQKLAFMAGEFDRAKIELRTSFDRALTTVSADAGQLWQAMLNLVRNSLEAMADNGGTLTIGTRRGEREALIHVTDTGKGMNAAQLEQIFVPFFTTKPQGTGLGLAVVQQIVVEHGGHVECESAPGKGSTFTIVLPLAETT